MIDNQIFELIPDLHIGVVICESIDNRIHIESTMDYLTENIEIVKSKMADINVLSELECIKEWRKVIKLFNEKKIGPLLNHF